MLADSIYKKSVELYADKLYQFVLKVTDDINLTREILEEVFNKFKREFDGQSFANDKIWLFKEANYTLSNDIRRKNTSKTFNIRDVDPLKKYDLIKTVEEIIEEAFQELRGTQKCLIVLRDYEFFTYEDLGLILNMDSTKVRSELFKARRALKRKLRDKPQNF